MRTLQCFPTHTVLKSLVTKEFVVGGAMSLSASAFSGCADQMPLHRQTKAKKTQVFFPNACEDFN